MNRRILLSLPLLTLVCISNVHRARAQEELPQKAAASGQLSIVQWVKPKTAGVLKGNVVAPVAGGASTVVDEAVVVLRGKDGWVGEAETNRLGRFTVTDVEPGVYSLLVKARGLFAFYAIQVVSDNEVDGHSYPERALVSCAYINEVAVSKLAKHVKGEMTISDVDLDPVGADVAQGGNASTGSVIQLTEGKLVGAMHQAGSGFLPAEGVKVTVIKDGEAVGNATTKSDGRFEIEGLDSGVYALVASGMSGVAVVGIEVKNGQANGQAFDATGKEGRFVTLRPQQDGGASQLSLQVSPNTLGEPDPTQEQENDFAAVGTGSGGGGGGGGAGGGVAALAAGAAAAAAASSGGDSIILASPAK